MNESVTAADCRRFDEVRQTAVCTLPSPAGIGTRGEHILHRILKNYYEPNPEFQEIKVGHYIADIVRGKEIIEIQTRAFRNLREKLPYFLTDHTVRVVYPIAETKYLSWIDTDTGEIHGHRKSPKKGGYGDFLFELYALRPILPLENLTFDLVFMDMEEYKLLCGRSKDRKHFGAVRYGRVPTRLIRIVTLSAPESYLQLLPEHLPETFTAAEYAKAGHISQGIVHRVIQTLVTLGVLIPTGKRGRSSLYKVLRESALP